MTPQMPRARRWLAAGFRLGVTALGASGLAACSILGGVRQPPAMPAPMPEIAATSTTIHPAIWPKGQSGVADDAAVDAEAATLLSRMSLEQKVGQIIMPDIGSITPDDVRQYHFGAIFNGALSGPDNDDHAPPPAWLKAADEYYAASLDVPAGTPAIPVIWGTDAVHGVNNIIGATIFPHNIGLGAMHDPALVNKVGAITAQELRVVGDDWDFAPTVAVVRDDRWGRSYEGFGEEPGLVAENAAAFVEGMQGTPGTPDFLKGPHVIATVKHFIGDGGTDGGVDQGDNLYGEKALRDIFAPPYEAAIQAGVQSVMTSFSSWRGHKMHGDHALLTDVLVKRLGFNGIVVGDWDGYAQLPGCSKIDCPQALLAGLDMYMAPDSWKGLYENTLREARSGIIPIARLDQAVLRILKAKIRAGVMDEGKPSARPDAGRWDLLGSPAHRAVARAAVRESLVLLKNENHILPLSPKLHVLVAGEGADSFAMQCGGWTISWQGGDDNPADYPHGQTIFDGIRQAVQAGGGEATFSVKGDYAQKPDVAIVVFGEKPYAEFKGDLSNVDFASGQHDLALLEKLKAAGIPVVSIFLSGRPLYVTPEINTSDAFVAAWLPGSEGEGVADLLFRQPDGTMPYDFRGRLSFSWPRAPDQTPLNADTEPYFPLFALGYGLDYAHPENIGQLPESAAMVSWEDEP